MTAPSIDTQHIDAFKLFTYACATCGYMAGIHNQRNGEAADCWFCPECKEATFQRQAGESDTLYFRNVPADAEYKIVHGTPQDAIRKLRARNRSMTLRYNALLEKETPTDKQMEYFYTAFAEYQEQIEQIEAGTHLVWCPGYPQLVEIEKAETG